MKRALRPLADVAEAVLELGRALVAIGLAAGRWFLRRGRAAAQEQRSYEAQIAQSPPSGPPEAERAMGSAASPSVRTRREMLTMISVGMGAVAAAVVAIPVVGALVAPLLRPQSPEWRTVGQATDFEVGKTVSVTFEDPSALSWAGVGSQTGAWLRRSSEQNFTAFAINCTHLGCPVRWLADADLFMCPCHGGVFYSNGAPAAGPPQQPLFLYPVRVRDGKVEILSGPVRVV